MYLNSNVFFPLKMRIKHLSKTIVGILKILFYTSKCHTNMALKIILKNFVLLKNSSVAKKAREAEDLRNNKKMRSNIMHLKAVVVNRSVTGEDKKPGPYANKTKNIDKLETRVRIESSAVLCSFTLRNLNAKRPQESRPELCTSCVAHSLVSNPHSA